MMAGIDESFDAALFVGYHARAGTDGGRARPHLHLQGLPGARRRHDRGRRVRHERGRGRLLRRAGRVRLRRRGRGRRGARAAARRDRRRRQGRRRARTAARLLPPEADAERCCATQRCSGRCGLRSGPQRLPGTSAPCGSSSRAATTATRPRPVPGSSASTRARSAWSSPDSSIPSPTFRRGAAAGRR